MLSTSRTYRYRIYPSKSQVETLNNNISTCAFVYNQLLEAKIKAYENEKLSLTKFDLNNYLIKLKTSNPEIREVHSQVLQNISSRIDKAMNHFYRRIKEKKGNPGFPRFKKKQRYKSITYPQTNTIFIENGRVNIPKIGEVKIVLHRELEGKIKTLTIKRTSSGKWFAIFTSIIDLEINNTKKLGEVGIDVGIESFAVLSDGTKIENPRYLIKTERRLSMLQKRLSRKKASSSNRSKSRMKLTKHYEKISSQRNDFLHKLSHFFVNKYGKIVIEDLKILNMVKHPSLSKYINDASWGTFFRNLEYKAEEAGIKVIRVSPNKTSITCSQCNKDVPKTLSIRWHACPNCGLYIHRDLNSAKLILSKADMAGTAKIEAYGDRSSSLNEISLSAK